MPILRKRSVYAILTAMVIGAGLASRSRFAHSLPDFVATYTGDILWALMVFLIVGFSFPTLQTSAVVAWAILFSFLIECSQLYQADWINHIRATRPGALMLGSGFLWSDLVCYFVGGMMGGIGEALFAWCWRGGQGAKGLRG